MRIVLALTISLFLIGGVYAYIRFDNSIERKPIEIMVEYSKGDFSIDIERSFECVSDPILETPSLKVLFKGETVFETTETIPTSEAVTIRPLSGVEVGENEVFVSATRSGMSEGLAVLKVTVRRNDAPITESLITGDGILETVSGPVSFLIPGEGSDENSHADHDH